MLDYYEIKNRPVRRVALYHGLTNVTLIGRYILNFLRREDHKADDTALYSRLWGLPSSGSPATSGARWSTSTGRAWARTSMASREPRRTRRVLLDEDVRLYRPACGEMKIRAWRRWSMPPNTTPSTPIESRRRSHAKLLRAGNEVNCVEGVRA